MTKLMTIPQAMELLAVGRTTVYELMRDRALPVVKVRGASRIPEEAVIAYIARNTIQAKKGA